MVSKIRVLSDQIINQIAAGEVIENPSSVVKELVDNAIDAKASEICVEIKGGGRQLIRVSDNGNGMDSDDAVLCLERHATSKLKSFDEIESIATMGFRGEAIPSIASISKFSLLTSPNSEGKGTFVLVEGGKLKECSPSIRSQGTTVEVKDLFFNVPVRKKFQKSPAYDQNEILRIVSSLALGNPEIHFKLMSNQETLLNCPKEDLKTRISSVLGPDFALSTCPLDYEDEKVHLHGYIGLPIYTRQNRTGQHLFINKRPISSPLISYAIKDGYGTMLSPNRHPVYVLHINLLTQTVDVNVHPQKKEVRFRQEADLKEAIVKAVQKTLQGGLIEEPHFPLATEEIVFTPQAPFKVEFPKPSYLEFKKNPEQQYRYETKARPAELEEKVLFPIDSSAPPPRILATMPNYILLEVSGRPDLCLIDQRAAHARIWFEKMSKKESLAIQHLLIPFTLQLTPLDAGVVLEHLERFKELGIGISEIGAHAFLVDAIPQKFKHADIESWILEMIHMLRNFSEKKIDTGRNAELASLAAKASMPAGKKLGIEEAATLNNELNQCANKTHCPRGKPIQIILTQDQIAKLFLR